MGLLIIVGVVMVLFVRWQSNKQQKPMREYQDMQISTEKLKRELERSGDEIIQRMGSHVNQLEKLVRETDEKSDALHRRMAELRALQQGMQQQIAEGRALQQQLLEQQRQCQQAYQQMAMHPMMTAAPMQFPAMMGVSAPQPVSIPAIEDAQTSEPMAQASFSQVLQDSIARDEAAQWPQDIYEPSVEGQQAALQAVPEIQNDGGREDSSVRQGDVNAAARARALLQEGYSVEEVSRETGMGRGAVELLRQMVQRQLAE